MLLRAFLVILFFAAVKNLLGQDKGISGFAVDDRGSPVAGAVVYGSPSNGPMRSDTSTTDDKGWFYLASPGLIVHFRSDGFQPKTLILKQTGTNLRVTLVPDTERFHYPECGTTVAGEQLLGWGTSRVRFPVPGKGLHVTGGDVDVDYVNYRITLRRHGAALGLWFGPTAWSLDPYDDQLVKSVEFSQRNIFNSRGVVGMDSRGRTASNRLWRHSGIIGAGAGYEDASPEEAAVFDRIIDSACVANDEKHTR